MDKKNITDYVAHILQKTFDALDDAYENNLEGKNVNAKSHLIFPKYSTEGENYRVSEQELRFEFIHQFLKNQEENKENTPKLYYSIETPTKRKYRFSKPKNSSESDDGYPKIDETGESAQFDVALFDEKAQRVCYIEFKAKNPSKESYEKDLLKLNTENENQAAFFVQLLWGCNQGTLPSIIKKIQPISSENRCLNDVIYVCHILKGKETYIYNNDNIRFIDSWIELH